MNLEIPGFEGTLEKLENLIPTKCSKCGKIPAKIEYKDKKYCTWYCAKKENK